MSLIMKEPSEVDDWERKKILGSGGFGVVNLWKNKLNNDYIAIKKCKWHLPTHLTAKQRERWTTEVQMMKTIKNINIVSFRELPKNLEEELLKHNPTKLPLLSMEYCSLGNLREVLARPENCCGLFELEVRFIFKDITNALCYLHNLNVTHRDVKPENIVLQRSSNRSTGIIYKLIDLGYAKELNSIGASFVGTLQYLAPEIFDTKPYDYTVDYWSFGITVFEVICGVRPFLHNLPPMKCFEYLEKKQSNIISIYVSHLGKIRESSELLSQIYVSSCFKQNFEKWLRIALEYDPKKRKYKQDNDSNLFKYLQELVDIKIITVFSVYTYEFYSYEVNDSTLLSTLQGWIARDTKVQVADQYLVSKSGCSSGSDDLAVNFYDKTNSEDAMLFVFKKGASLNENSHPQLPKLIKMSFENNGTMYNNNILKLLYSHIIYFIIKENKHFFALKQGTFHQIRFVKMLYGAVINLYNEIKNTLAKIMDEVKFYNRLEKTLQFPYKTNRSSELVANRKNYRQNMTELKVLFSYCYKQEQTCGALGHRLKTVQDDHQRLESVFDDFDTNNSYQEALQLYVQGNATKSGKVMLKPISNTIKLRDKLLRNKFLQQYVSDIAGVHNSLDDVLKWLVPLKTKLNEVGGRIEKTQMQFVKLLQETSSSKRVSQNMALDTAGNNSIQTKSLIEENIVLRYKIQEALNKGLQDYKNILEDVKLRNTSNEAVNFSHIVNGTEDLLLN